MAALQSHSRNDYGIFPMDEIQLFGGNICGRNWTRKIENGAQPLGGAIGNDFQAKSPYAKRCADTFEFIVRQLTDKLNDGAHLQSRDDHFDPLECRSSPHEFSFIGKRYRKVCKHTFSPITGAHILASIRSIHR